MGYFLHVNLVKRQGHAAYCDSFASISVFSWLLEDNKRKNDRAYGKAGIRNPESIRLLPSLCIPCKMDDDIRSPFKKRYEYKEHSSYRSLQLM